MIPHEIIEEIKFRNDIESVISSYVNLKPAGSNLVGLCPFHSEKTPSFTVFKNEGNFKCFGCGAGGDVITFIMKAENLDYIGAIELLAKRVGITIPEQNNKSPDAIPSKRICDMNREAAKFFHSTLISPLGRSGLDYLTQKRKFSSSLINHFGLGFAPNSFNALSDHLKKLGYSEKELKAGFLCGTSKKTGNIFDLFRNRVIVPIIDTKGDVIAFGGRVLDDSLPKYLNSSDTPAFKKSRNLFALNFAKSTCGEQLILCEGYMDVIALHGAGFTNSVATLGTAITSEQARIISRYTKKVVIAYDSDSAGQTASEKAFRLLKEVGLDVRILRMTGAKDPDEYIKKFGKAQFEKLLDESRTHFDFRLDKVLDKYDINNDTDKIKAVSELVDFISDTGSAVERELYIRKTSEKFGISQENIKHDVERARRKKQKATIQNEAKKIIAQTSGVGDRINPDYMKNVKAASAEEAILGILLKYPENFGKIEKGVIPLSPDDFFTEFGKKVFVSSFEIWKNTEVFDFGLLGEYFSADEMGRITSYLTKRYKLSSNGETELSDCVKKLKEEKKLQNADLKTLLESRRNKNNKPGTEEK